MTVKMMTSTYGAASKSGATTRLYQAGEELPMDEEWQRKLALIFVEMGVAAEVQETKVTEVKDTEAKPRGRPKKVI